ncbi:MAG TPA: alkaline phosphatase family protein [Candidatus Acidoferrales bacterium]|nr:alkaline phosphatase family protein [Candidatus Acidoferrales bacterium]
MSVKHKPKVAMLGFDAAEFSYIAAHLSSLPNFSRALGRGILRHLDSPAQIMAGSVWPTFYTASPPGEHGIHHLMQWDADAMRLRRTAADWLYCEPFWRELERRGHRVVALDVPMCFPSERGGAVEVSSWGAHDQLSAFSAHPRELEREIRRRFGQHPMGIEIPVEKSLAERMRVRTNLVDGARIKGEMTRWLLTSQEWDFFIGVFGESHRGGHILWPDNADAQEATPPSALLDVYRALDQALGDLLAAIDLNDTTVILFALHGMGPNLSQEHFVPPMMDLINVRFSELEPDLYANTGPPRQRSLMRLLREKVPPRLQSAIANMVPQRVRDAVVDRALTSGYDWARTPGLAVRADCNGFIRFNLVGRETQGMLEAGSAILSRYSELISESFATLRTTDGQPLVGEVLAAAENFPGARSDRLPDLIVMWTGLEPAAGATSALGMLDDKLDTGRGGNHLPTGFQILLQPGLEQPSEDSRLSISDFARSILRMFDA